MPGSINPVRGKNPSKSSPHFLPMSDATVVHFFGKIMCPLLKIKKNPPVLKMKHYFRTVICISIITECFYNVHIYSDSLVTWF